MYIFIGFFSYILLLNINVNQLRSKAIIEHGVVRVPTARFAHCDGSGGGPAPATATTVAAPKQPAQELAEKRGSRSFRKVSAK